MPSLRDLEQFDQIMTEQYGLWEKVMKNLETGIIKKETVLVGDTVHCHAYTEF
jgi:hypothetical protein